MTPEQINIRCINAGNYIIKNHTTVRKTAQALGEAKTTVWVDVTVRLPKINKTLAKKVNKQLTKNKAVRHLRGGEATRAKYKQFA